MINMGTFKILLNGVKIGTGVTLSVSDAGNKKNDLMIASYDVTGKMKVTGGLLPKLLAADRRMAKASDN